MPTYAYKCNDCDTKFEVIHKTYEEENKIKCQKCSSENSRRLMTAANIGSLSNAKAACEGPNSPSCASGMCPYNY